MRNTVEVLAPAGSYDIMKAVIEAGADAIYLGGSMFGARAYANNFNKEELLRAIDYAHLHGKKIYLTVNTLMKERECAEYLVDYLLPYYQEGLDAVIVQDFGAFDTIRKYFPGMHIHASTQMTATGVHAAALLKEAGANRVVTARELNLSEIKQIHDHVDVEIESFVHGALCYCYSGQCLLSSFNGARSGNRGRCAQPCRLAYEAWEKDMRINQKQEDYVLSPKDMCALPILPDVIDAGVYSLKIEGRMKNVNYAAGVTAAYRKYTDMYLERGRAKYHVDERDLQNLMDIYNRGAFTTGYYNHDKGRDMISLSRPNHMGTKALQVMDNQNGRVTFEALENITPQDVFEIDSEHSFESGQAVPEKSRMTVNLPKKYNLSKGTILYRMKKGSLTKEIEQKYVATTRKLPVQIFVSACLGQPLHIMFTDVTSGITVNVSGQTVDAAKSKPTDKEQIAQAVTKLGDTLYEPQDIFVEADDAIFVPVGQMKELRRQAVEAMMQAVIAHGKRKMPVCPSELLQKEYKQMIAGDTKEVSELEHMVHNHNNKEKSQKGEPQISVLVTTKAQAQEVLQIAFVDWIYVDFLLLYQDTQRQQALVAYVQQCADNKKKLAIVLPHVLRGKYATAMRAFLTDCIQAQVDTFVVRNLEEMGLLADIAKKDGRRVSVILDAGMYTWNERAVAFAKQLSEELSVLRATYPLELTREELCHGDIARELIVYTRIPLMLSEQCVKRTLGKCDGQSGQLTLKKDRQLYLLQSVCSLCYTVLYDSKIYQIADLEEEIRHLQPDAVRYELLDDVSFANVLDKSATFDEKYNTRGHFELGVE